MGGACDRSTSFVDAVTSLIAFMVGVTLEETLYGDMHTGASGHRVEEDLAAILSKWRSLSYCKQQLAKRGGGSSAAR